MTLDGDDYRQRPLEARREALSKLLAGVDDIRHIGRGRACYPECRRSQSPAASIAEATIKNETTRNAITQYMKFPVGAEERGPRYGGLGKTRSLSKNWLLR